MSKAQTLKILIHKNSKIPLKVISQGTEEVILTSKTITGAFWELAQNYPDEVIGWCEVDFVKNIDRDRWNEIFHHDLIMASYAIETTFLPDSIGYVDQMPFVNVNRNVLFPTWQMSSDIGGVKGEALLKFKNHLEEIKNLDFLLNSVAKIGQQNGLFCYSAPRLINCSVGTIQSKANLSQLVEFVYRHYNTIWVIILIYSLARYEKKISLQFVSSTLGKKKFFRQKIDFNSLSSISLKTNSSFSVDVIIPTMGRAQYLIQVLKDFKYQSLIPKKVIIVEQNSDKDSTSDLPEFNEEEWPFEIIHHFIHRTGACYARNLALEDITSSWVFLADDDIRIESDLLKKARAEIEKYQISALNMNCRQKGEETVFEKVKQWGSFGSGTSIVKSSFANKCRFGEQYEFGYGEDADFGMQLRNLGCDIIYHPELEITHLKAPVGGFRRKPILEWEKEIRQSKPSPTIMYLAKKYYTEKQIKGFKISLFLKFYPKQEIKNPLSYVNDMEKRWRRSEYWAELLMASSIQDGINRMKNL